MAADSKIPVAAKACGFASLRRNKHLTKISENMENGIFAGLLWQPEVQGSATECRKNRGFKGYW
jgi:hypothetical protein